MLNKIKNEIFNNIGNCVDITYNGSRNKIENYKGIITEVYNSLFIVKLDNDLKKSFSYSDVLIGIVNIKY